MTLSSSAIAAAGRLDAVFWAPSGTRQTTARTTNTNTARTRTDIYAMCEYTLYAYSWFPPALAADRPASRARVARSPRPHDLARRAKKRPGARDHVPAPR